MCISAWEKGRRIRISVYPTSAQRRCARSGPSCPDRTVKGTRRHTHRRRLSPGATGLGAFSLVDRLPAAGGRTSRNCAPERWPPSGSVLAVAAKIAAQHVDFIRVAKRSPGENRPASVFSAASTEDGVRRTGGAHRAQGPMAFLQSIVRKLFSSCRPRKRSLTGADFRYSYVTGFSNMLRSVVHIARPSRLRTF